MVEPSSQDGAVAAPRPCAFRPAWLPLLAVAVALALAYWPLFAGQIVFHRDSVLWVFPARWFVRQALLTGQSPLWNPLQGLGFPLLADPQYAVFYPPHWLFLLVPDGMVAHLQSWLSLTHLLWGGLGMALLTRRLGACCTGAAVAGLAWSLSGHTTSAWMIGPLLLAHAWIPWVARGFLGLARKQGRFPLLAAVWPMAMSLLVGEVFVSGMALLFAAVVVVAGARSLRPTRAGATSVARAGAAWLVAVAIAAVAWLPSVLMVGSTERAQAFDRASAELYSHHPLRVLEMVAPGALGDATGEYPAGRWVGEPAASGAPLFFSSYLGVATLAFVLLGLRRKQLHLTLALAAGVALLLAFGKHAPVHQVWRTILFPFAHMHSPEKYVVLVVAALAPLAGLGASALLAAGKPNLRRLGYFGGALALLALTAQLLLPDELAPTARWACLRGLATLVLLFAMLKMLVRIPRAATLAMLTLVALDLGIPASRLTGFGSAELLTRVPPAAATVLSDSRGNPSPPRLYRALGLEQAAAPLGPHATWEDSQERALASLTPNTLNVFGLATVPGFASAIPDLLSQISPRSLADLGRMLRVFAVPYALLADTDASELAKTGAVKALSHPLPKGSLVRVDEARPRVYLPGRIRSLPPSQAGAHLFDDAVVAGREVILLTASQPSLIAASENGESHACTLDSFTNTRIVAQCQTPVPSVAVFVEQFDPGWSATVDGQPAPIVRANLLARAVPLRAGNHRIELEYHAPGLRLAILLSTIGLFGLAGAMILERRRRRMPGT